MSEGRKSRRKKRRTTTLRVQTSKGSVSVLILNEAQVGRGS